MPRQRPPRDPASLSKAELAGLVRSLQEWMYMDNDGNWISGKEVDGADTISLVEELLSIDGLSLPESPAAPEEWKP